MSLAGIALGLRGKDVAVARGKDAFVFTTRDRPQPLVLPAIEGARTVLKELPFLRKTGMNPTP